MKIKLLIEQEEKTFSVPFITGRMFRKSIDMQKKLDGMEVDTKMLDEMADYVVDAFGSQFTQDQFYDGIEGKRIIPTVIEIVMEIMGKTSGAVGTNSPND